MVERWSSKPYAWVRFLLPLHSIPTSLQLRQSKISQNNYFNNTLNTPLKKANLYKALFGKLFVKKKSKKENIYFRSTLRVNKPSYAGGSGFFFRKLHFLTTYTQPHLNQNIHCFKMFLNNQSTNLASVNNPSTPRSVLHSSIIKVNTSYSILSLNSLKRSSWHELLTPWSQANLRAPVNLRLSQTYYTNLQPKSVKLITHYQLLKTLTSKYSLVRKIRNNWERFSNLKDRSLHFTKYSLPTLSIVPRRTVSLSTPQTLVGALPTLRSSTQFGLVPKINPVNLFNKLFTKNLFTSFLIYKRFYLSTALLTERPNKLLIKNSCLFSYKNGQLSSNIVCLDLPKTPRLFLNLKNTKAAKLQTNFLCWYNFLLIRFLQHTTGLKVSLMFNPFLHKALSLIERAQLDLWTQRVKGFQRIIGPKISLKESLQVTYLSLKLKDPSLFSSWLSRTIHKVSFWKYRAFFRYLKFLLQNLFLPSFSVLGMKGVKLKLKGKVSVAGNARTRSIYYRVGSTGQSTLNSKVLHNLTFFYTFTGILGLQIWFYF